MLTTMMKIIHKESIEEEGEDKKFLLSQFKLPINYIEQKYEIQDNIKTDLELVSTTDHPSLYSHIFSPISQYATKIIPMWSDYYTIDTAFLKDTQYLFRKFKHIQQPNITEIDNIHAILEEITNETGFYEKYRYIDVKLLESLNHSPLFLQLYTLYNLASPVISLIIPIIMLIIPFFILKMQGLSISINMYFKTLLVVLKNHVVGKAISEFSTVGWDRKFFMIISVIFYFINIYQNFIACHTFYKNIYKIQNYLTKINDFLQYSINSINNLNKYCKSSHINFVNTNEVIKNKLYNFSREILSINLEQLSIKQIGKIGAILHSFYQLFKNKIYKEAITYALYLHGYIENITNLQGLITSKTINYCKFTKKTTNFSEAYFASLINNNPIKNTFTLNKNILITGPNAAGKTTLLKTTLFNIILSQQIGIGCYKSCCINPYRYIHCYINIPDTSQRDSLFQAEARRCKEILDSIANSNISDRHFCIFDEIYSGTNPSEAIASAFSFLKYISAHSNMSYVLTTHYISLCKLLNNTKTIDNQQMQVTNNANTYKLISGISNIKGGIKVLEELDYNAEIIQSAKTILKTINI